MKYLLWFDAVMAATGATLAIGVGFVAGVYWLYRDASPVLRNGLGDVLLITACFLILFVLAGAALVGLRRRRAWHWAAQGFLVLSLPLLFKVIVAHLQTR